MKENEVVILLNLLSVEALQALEKDCDEACEGLSLEEFTDNSCAIDLFEKSPLDDERIRTCRLNYLEERWKRGIFHLSQDDRKIIASTLFTTLPAAIHRVVDADKLYLFNEHYVVKPPESHITFKWHKDADEQLECCPKKDLEYISCWCPLDDAHSSNGTLQIPSSVSIRFIDENGHEVSFSDTQLSEYVSSSKLSTELEEGIIENDEPSDAFVLSIPRGTGVLFSSHLLHCSGPNESKTSRRVFYAQYSTEIISIEESDPDYPLPQKRKLEYVKDDRLPLSFAILCDKLKTS